MSSILNIPQGKRLELERFSDSSNSFNPLDRANPHSYKQLYRAAKAKLKLRLRAQVVDIEQPATLSTPTTTLAQPQLQTVAAALRPSSTEVESAAPVAAASPSLQQDMTQRLANMKLGGEAPKITPMSSNALAAWQVCCNNCDKAMPNEHYHCSTCDDGDYDLCVQCVTQKGISCPGDNHWLIKRSIQNGKVINSTTERLAPQPRAPVKIEEKTPVPGAFVPELAPALAARVRTCNACVTQMEEHHFVNCIDCPDFDLCVDCLKNTEHGHHPGHSFKPMAKTAPTADLLRLCSNNQSKRHHAICDACDESIFGIRHKCLDCPDFDLCSQCYTVKSSAHTGHRFVPVYDAIKGDIPTKARHYGIYCDGPLCAASAKRSYICGPRYKCAICHDTDFCANCEAHPDNKHVKSHPLIKFSTPVGNATIATIGEDRLGRPMPAMGDRNAVLRQSASSSTLPPYTPAAPAVKAVEPASAPALDAHFMREIVADGTKFSPNTRFGQSWTLRNPGPLAWPAGVAIHSTGGDKMINIDPSSAASIADIISASRSNETSRPILPGEEFTFSVELRTPPRVGKQISYWRAKLNNGEAFGHKLWCEIEVVEPVRPFDADRKERKVSQVPHAQPVQNVETGAKQTVTASGAAQSPFRPVNALRDFQMQLMLLEQQNRKRLFAAREGQQPESSEPARAALDGRSLDRAREERIATRLAHQREVARNRASLARAAQHNQTGRSREPLNDTRALEQQAQTQNQRLHEIQERQRRETMQQEMMQQQQRLFKALCMQKGTTPASSVQHNAGRSVPVSAPENTWARGNIPIMRHVANNPALSVSSNASEHAAAAALPPTAANATASGTSDAPVEADARKPEPVAQEKTEKLQGSQMVFPTLEKESPSSSIHQESTGEAATEEIIASAPANVVRPSTASTVAESEARTPVEDEDVQEYASVEFEESDSDDDDAFLTDEEYDILDASDEEIMSVGRRNV